jgi:hypothetical protein
MIIEYYGMPGSGKSYIASSEAKKNNILNFEEVLFSKKGLLFFRLFVHFNFGYIFEYAFLKTFPHNTRPNKRQ